MKERCALCDEAYDLLKVLELEYPLTIEEVDIYNDDELFEKYHIDIPVIKIKNDEITAQQLTYEKIETTIQKHL